MMTQSKASITWTPSLPGLVEGHVMLICDLIHYTAYNITIVYYVIFCSPTIIITHVLFFTQHKLNFYVLCNKAIMLWYFVTVMNGK